MSTNKRFNLKVFATVLQKRDPGPGKLLFPFFTKKGSAVIYTEAG